MCLIHPAIFDANSHAVGRTWGPIRNDSDPRLDAPVWDGVSQWILGCFHDGDLNDARIMMQMAGMTCKPAAKLVALRISNA